jgi:putative ABC transport system permease protein
VKALDRKLLRDLWRGKAQVVTTGLVLGAAVATFVSMSGTYRSLALSRDAYYAAYDFPDLFATLKRAPEGVADRLRAIPGVARVDTRLVEGARLEVPGVEGPLLGKLISLRGGARPTLEGIHLVSGRPVDPARPREVLINESFAKAQRLAPGDRLWAVLEGRRFELEVSGIALSPEYIFTLGPSGMTDDKRFGVLWLGRDALAALSDGAGSFNDVTFRLGRGANEDEVIAAVDRELARYGGTGAIGRKDQISNKIVADEIEQLAGIAVRIPFLFLVVGVFVLQVIVSRMVRVQREQIAALRALGYTRGRIAVHYLEFVAAIVAVGIVSGLAFGQWFGRWFIGVYTTVFHLPVLRYAIEPSVLAISVGVSLAAASGAVLVAVRRAVSAPPAEAMRPPAPAVYRVGFLSRLGVPRLLRHTGRIVLRELERRPFRALLSTLGLSLGVGILILGRFSWDSFERLIEVQFGVAQPADATVTFPEPVPASAVGEVARLPGVIVAEPMRAVPARIRHAQHHRDLVLQGLAPNGALRKVVDRGGRPVPLPAEGLLVTDKLAEILEVRPGDLVDVEELEGERRRLRIPIAATTSEGLGLQAYMRLDALDRALGQAPAVSGVYVEVDRTQEAAFTDALAALPRAGAASWRAAILRAFHDQAQQITGTMTIVLAIIGSVITIGVVYNHARVALSERGRDLATLRVLGFTRREVAGILFGELAVHVLLAVPLGLFVGRLMALSIVATVDAEQYRLPLVIAPSTYAIAAAVMLAASAASAWIVRRKLDRLDLLDALKARD